MLKTVLFSIIVPVYNTEKYLHRCIQSVLNQTCKEYELILVDDGSTDGSAKICDEYSCQFHNIHVIHQENRGLANARNSGLDLSEGRYILFVDSDDYIEKELLLKAYTQLEEKDFDCFSFAARRVDIHENTLYDLRFEKMIKCVTLTKENIDDFLFCHFLQYEAGWEACFYVYKRSIIEQNRMRFQESLRYAEDIAFTFEYMLCIKNWVKVPDILYNYTEHENTITGKTGDEEKIRSIFFNVCPVLGNTLKKAEMNSESREILLLCSLIRYFLMQNHAALSEQLRNEIFNLNVIHDGLKSTKNLRKVLTGTFGKREGNELYLYIMKDVMEA